MRSLLLLATLPLLAAAPSKGKAVKVKVTITQASVTWGAGKEPKGAMAPARLHGEVTAEGLKPGAKAELRAWRLLAADLPALTEGAQLRFVRGGKGRVEAKVAEQGKGAWTLQGEWPGAAKTDERLVVEVWVGTHRVGYAVSPLAEQAIPVGRPQPGDEKN